MRLLILATLAATTVFTTPCMAEDPEFRLNYSANRGEILVLTAAGNIKRSNYDVSSIAEMQRKIDTLSSKLKSVEERLAKLEKEKP